jgi:hypothetical protein
MLNAADQSRFYIAISLSINEKVSIERGEIQGIFKSEFLTPNYVANTTSRLAQHSLRPVLCWSAIPLQSYKTTTLDFN